MENKIIPTAKEFIQNYIEENNHDSNIDMEESMIEFAKLHVEAALKEASENAKVQMGDNYILNKIAIYPNSVVDTAVIKVNSASILNSYSLDNIK